MIGTTFGFTDQVATNGNFPDHTANITTLALVNQDGFSSEYRFRGALHDYAVAIRNSNETPDKSGIIRTRHNVELRFTQRASIAAGIVTPAVPYVVGVTMRMPSAGTSALMLTSVNHLLRVLTASLSAIPGKMLNFES